jgi:hypothetical protein
MSLTPRLHTLSMQQVAEFVGRSYGLVKRYYAAGLPPEPAHSVRMQNKTQRFWTLDEAKQLKLWFKGIKWGSLRQNKKRAAIRKETRRAFQAKGKVKRTGPSRTR